MSAGRTHYILFNKSLKVMQNRFVLDTLSAAHELTATALTKADRAFYRQRRTMEDSYGMPHGTFSGV